ncbi:MAG: class I SAM-dependent methyltransferase [Anaerolineae bacterium]|nr:class I SAM-dependent methyltransferase [Anaerolineae bacterium]
MKKKPANREISRVLRTKEQARAAYDSLSRWYDFLAGWSERAPRNLGLALLSPSRGERILEIGVGTGHAVAAIAQAVGQGGKAVGIDISAGMLEIACSQAVKAGISDRVDLICADAALYPFPPGAYDAVFMSFTLELFDTPEIPGLLAACRRALKNGGRICVVSMAKQQKDSLPVRIYEWFHKTMPAYVDCRPIFVQHALVQAGFKIDTVRETKMWGLPVEIVLALKS